MIRTLAAALCLAFAAPALAAGGQQQVMKDCNVKAADLKGADRKAFMSKCLKGEDAAPVTQQQKMKDCNAKAGDMKGADRKAFMSKCLKGN
jgi:hypothetical protein